jgi:hypothetical protein
MWESQIRSCRIDKKEIETKPKQRRKRKLHVKPRLFRRRASKREITGRQRNKKNKQNPP